MESLCSMDDLFPFPLFNNSFSSLLILCLLIYVYGYLMEKGWKCNEKSVSMRAYMYVHGILPN